MTAEEAMAKRERRVVRLTRIRTRLAIAHIRADIADSKADLSAWRMCWPDPPTAQRVPDGNSVLAQAKAKRYYESVLAQWQFAEKRAPAGDVAEARRRLGLP